MAHPKLALVDGHAVAFRAFHALRDANLRTSDGEPTYAVYGFWSIVLTTLQKLQPEFVAVSFDVGRTFRHEEYVDYKAGRAETPDEFRVQLTRIKQIVEALNIPIYTSAGFEADDVIGTLATGATLPVDIVTGDRDLFQLVDDARDVRVIYTAKGMSNLEIVTDATVVTKYGVLPSQYADFATLRGDASDGLPGVTGIGEKTAATLLAAHGDLAGIIAAAKAGEGMSAGLRSKISAALPYLAVAPTVVEVSKNLDLGDVDSRLPTPHENARADAAALAEQWSLGSAMSRILDALGHAASR